MSDNPISISDTLYEKAHRVAEQTAQQVDDVIRERLADAFDVPLAELPVDELAELRALAYLSDDTLWTIARADASHQAGMYIHTDGQEFIESDYR
jgi:hypothetical protein